MNIIKKIILSSVVSTILCLTVAAQKEMLFPLHSNPVIKKYLKEHPNAASTSNQRIGVQNDTIQLPFRDDFSYDGIYPDQKLWTDSDVYINRDFPIDPPTIGVATFDGTNKYGNPYSPGQSFDSIADHLTSYYINLNFPGDTTIWLSFFYQPQGRSYYAPYPVDSLILEFKDPSDDSTWNEVWGIPGRGDTVFQEVMINIRDTAIGYLNGHFQFRFTNIANLNGNADQWNIDYVRIDRNRTATDTGFTNEGAFLYRNKSLLVYPYTSLPYSHFKSDSTQLLVDHDTAIYKNLTNGPDINFANDFQIKIAGSVYYDTHPNAVNVPGDSTVKKIQPFPGISLPLLPQPSLEFTTWNINETPDGNPQNDTVRETQLLSNYYSYDDGTAEAAYGIQTATDNSEGELALQFDLKMQDTLRGVQIYWNQIPSNPDPHTQLINIAVWNQLTPNTNNANLIYQLIDAQPQNDSTFNDSAMDSFYTYTFDSLLIVKGTIYIGWIQLQQAFLNVGFDLNTDTHSLLYFNVLDDWQQSDIAGSVMIRPLFGSSVNVGVKEINEKNFSATVFPNPASQAINISVHAKHPSSYSFQLFDAIGKLVVQQKEATLDVSTLHDGFYLLKIADDKSGQFVTNKIAIKH